jgi:hypothetical protein
MPAAVRTISTMASRLAGSMRTPPRARPTALVLVGDGLRGPQGRHCHEREGGDARASQRQLGVGASGAGGDRHFTATASPKAHVVAVGPKAL